jgi:hypothetical protein
MNRKKEAGKMDLKKLYCRVFSTYLPDTMAPFMNFQRQKPPRAALSRRHRNRSMFAVLALGASMAFAPQAWSCEMLKMLSGNNLIAFVQNKSEQPYNSYESYLIRSNARGPDGTLSSAIKAELVPQRWGYDLKRPDGTVIAVIGNDAGVEEFNPSNACAGVKGLKLHIGSPNQPVVVLLGQKQIGQLIKFPKAASNRYDDDPPVRNNQRVAIPPPGAPEGTDWAQIAAQRAVAREAVKRDLSVPELVRRINSSEASLYDLLASTIQSGKSADEAISSLLKSAEAMREPDKRLLAECAGVQGGAVPRQEPSDAECNAAASRLGTSVP